MTKMNLDFLLSPDTGNGNAERSSASRSSRVNGNLSLDFIAPRNSRESDKHNRSSRQHRHHNRDGHHSRSAHVSSRTTHSTTSRVNPSASKNHGHSSNRSKPRKPKNEGSPSRAGSSQMENRPHVCRSCQRGFYKLEQLKRHDRLVHLNLRPFKCTTCRLSFGTKQNMQVHLTTRKHKHKLETLQTDLQYPEQDEEPDQAEDWSHHRHHAQHGSSSRHHR